MAKGRVIRRAIKSLEENKEAIQNIESGPLQQSVKTINAVLLDLLKNDTA
jgi:hypothetical protein